LEVAERFCVGKRCHKFSWKPPRISVSWKKGIFSVCIVSYDYWGVDVRVRYILKVIKKLVTDLKRTVKNGTDCFIVSEKPHVLSHNLAQLAETIMGSLQTLRANTKHDSMGPRKSLSCGSHDFCLIYSSCQRVEQDKIRQTSKNWRRGNRHVVLRDREINAPVKLIHTICLSVTTILYSCQGSNHRVNEKVFPAKKTRQGKGRWGCFR
jgi:hypothetical protein